MLLRNNKILNNLTDTNSSLRNLQLQQQQNQNQEIDH